MKLKCDAHNRRVVQGQKGWIHRNGDGSPCGRGTVTIGTQTFGFRESDSISVTNAVKNKKPSPVAPSN